ncbi:lipoprotein [Actinocatenispora thailandica]|uniref:Lipoprotein n=2 Tax=Actinocatenispora thailandica TaxID=227318 RepID=A0A7R7I102_9ACTN|nr:lipoprotein [Actinocatenispora thailandica]
MIRSMRIRALVVASATALGTVAAATPAVAHPAPGRHDAGACSRYVSLRGFSDALDKRKFGDAQIGELSGLQYDGSHLRAVSDTSALWTLTRPTRGLGTEPVGYQPLADEHGDPIDSEAIAVDRDGTRLITSEIEPSVRRYDRRGKVLGSLPVPGRFRVAPAGEAEENATFEGLTLLPGDRSLIATMESPLSGDGTDADGNGLNRFLRWDRRHGRFEVAAQYAFTVDAGLQISDVQAISPNRLLVLERGWRKGYGNTIRLYEADLTGAQDVTGVASLADTTVRQVHRRLLADLAACPSDGATAKQPQPNPLLDNIEGMVFTGRHLRGDRRELLMVSDDNLSDEQITRLYSFAVRV